MRHLMRDAWSLGRKPRICVVGAGFSGLVCAERLGKQGMDVTVVEARDRVGGRVHQLNTLGHWTDMGANWIHGPLSSPIREVAKKVGAITVEGEENAVVYDEDGHLLAPEFAQEVEGIVWSCLSEAFKYSESHDDIPATQSLKDFVTERVNSMGLPEHTKKTVLQLAEQWGGFIGTLYERQSLKYLFLESSVEGHNAFIASTYRDILQFVSKQADVRSNIRLGWKITSITYSAGMSSSQSSSVSVDLEPTTPNAGGLQQSEPPKREEYDAIVITVPLGCLRDKSIRFQPSFPPDFQHAIDSITYGTLEKVYFKFPRAFWLDSSNTEPFLRVFIHPKYAEQNPENWQLAVLNMASFSKKRDNVNHPTLLFYVYGPCGTHVTNLITDLSPEDPLYSSRLTDFFQPYFSRLPNYNETDPDCKPDAVLATDWQHDALAGHGSYTNWQIDDNEEHGLPPKMPLDKAIETIRDGLPDRKLWFAGEHTAPFNALGTVTGAYWSGEAVAKRITDHFSTVIRSESKST